MSSVSPTNQDLSNDTTFSQIKSRVPVPLKQHNKEKIFFAFICKWTRSLLLFEMVHVHIKISNNFTNYKKTN